MGLAKGFTTEQLCCLSRVLASGKGRVPGLTGTDHSVQDGKELVHASHESDFFRLTSSKQAIVESFDDRIATNGG